MYPSKGSGAFGQAPYAGQQAFGQLAGAGDGARKSMMGTGQEADLSGYRAHSAAQGAQYGGPYAAVYGSSALTAAHQAAAGGKVNASSALQSRYPSALPESSKFSSAALGSNLGMNSDDYASATNLGRHYGDQTAYLGRDLQKDPARRYADSVSVSQQHQADMHDHMDQASLLRQQQLLKAQSLQSSDMRQAEYLAARNATLHHGSQEYGSYAGRMDVDPRSLPILGSAPYGNQHAASILGAPRRNVDELYSQSSSSAAYGVGLPPGRDYAVKSLHGQSLESEYQALSRGHPSLGVSIVDERKDDRAYRRELERDEERRRELIREKEKEREREERERQREKERERERLLERRERERERDRKRALDARREKTPPRSARDRRGSSLLKDERTSRKASPRRSSPRRASPRRASPRRASPRRASPRREADHRPRSPVREKKREYTCKVFPFSLVEVERDYLSLNKRYPRLFISPECSKVILHWPKQTLHLSLHTPVSFEHEYVEVDSKADEKALVPSDELSKLKHGNVIWNAKVILMSGMSTDALNEMCSYKTSDERIVHFNNVLRFAILKKDHSFMAIGGPWNAALDGGDPMVEDSSLIQTACRYLKDVTQLDLQNCQHWNRFLEIHYDRVGEDGMFSHKEITVLFVPDLSECLPTIDAWRAQWITHKKEIAERERKLSVKEKKSGENKESGQDKVKADDSAGKGTKVTKTVSVKETEIVKDDDTKDAIKESNKESVVDPKGEEHQLDERLTEENAEGACEEGKTNVKNAIEGANADASVEKPKMVKKKIIKRVVKGKAAAKKAANTTVEADGKKGEDATVEDTTANIDDKVDAKTEGTVDSANTKTLTGKKIVKKVPAGKSAQKVDINVDASANQSEKKSDTEMIQEEKTIKKESDEATAAQETGVKTSGKKKIIRRIIKRKVSGADAVKKETENANATPPKAIKKEETKDQVEKMDVGTSNFEDTTKSTEPQGLSIEKGSSIGKNEKAEKEAKKEIKLNEKSSKVEKGADSEVPKEKDLKKNDHGSKKDRTKDEKQNKSKDGKHDSKQKSPKEAKEKGKSEEPPQHPGFFLQTKRSKGSKIRSMSLSLDGLLDYNDKDVEESTFELSLCAESLNELLQYQMGCRLLSFLEKLRRRFVIQKNQRKRQRDEKHKKDNEESSSLKRSKITDESGEQNGSPKSEKKDTSGQGPDETMGEGGSTAEHDESHMDKSNDGNDDVEDEQGDKSYDDILNENDEEEEDPEEEDPEEIIEDDQEMNDVASTGDGVKEDKKTAKTDASSKPEKETTEEDDKKHINSKNVEPMDDKLDKEKKEDDKRSEAAKSDSGKEEVFDKEVLQAFRYFDYNRVGYIKVEDLRCLLHNLGKFISHRDVKELVQSALFESNTARDNRIFYKKLVKLTDI